METWARLPPHLELISSYRIFPDYIPQATQWIKHANSQAGNPVANIRKKI